MSPGVVLSDRRLVQKRTPDKDCAVWVSSLFGRWRKHGWWRGGAVNQDTMISQLPSGWGSSYPRKLRKIVWTSLSSRTVKNQVLLSWGRLRSEGGRLCATWGQTPGNAVHWWGAEPAQQLEKKSPVEDPQVVITTSLSSSYNCSWPDQICRACYVPSILVLSIQGRGTQIFKRKEKAKKMVIESGSSFEVQGKNSQLAQALTY